ncbi:MAG TPA: hypothetical protein VEL76_32080 [Gemmataceae bacterium]|nr:hypothetical protein [Gemmataceae bacterium]
MSEPLPYSFDFDQAGLAPEQREEFERWLRQPVAPEILEADKVFREQLPELLRTHPNQWVAYSGSQCLGFHTSGQALYQECLAQGFAPEQFVVKNIAPLLEGDDLIV